MIATYSGEIQPKVHLDSFTGVIRLVHPSLETWFVRHEVGILAIMSIAWLVSIALILGIAHWAPTEDDAAAETAWLAVLLLLVVSWALTAGASNDGESS